MENFLEIIAHYALPFVGLITVVVFVHEFGHYWVARRCGVKIETFSIGFGHEIFGWTDKRGTRWKVSWLPLGGYVKMFGDANVASAPDASVRDMTSDEKKISFFHQRVEKRMAVIVAGPAANYIFAIVVLSILFMFYGHPFSPPQIGEVVIDTPAQKAGLQTGDRILKLDGKDVASFEEISNTVLLNTGTPMAVELQRGEKIIDLTITPSFEMRTDHFGMEHKTARIGIKSVKPEYKQLSPVAAVGQAFSDTWTMSVTNLKAVGQMIEGSRGTEDVGGPLRIAQLSGAVAKEGPIAFILLMVTISVSLGLINLFPVPLLDGGHLVFYAVEWIRGRPLSLKVQEIGSNVGAFMVVGLMLFATFNDILHVVVAPLMHK